MQAIPDVPPAVRQVLESVVDAAQRAFGDDLAAVILYGSAAEGRLRATSDVNLLFVLRKFASTNVDTFREPFRFSRAAANITAMFLLENEIEAAAGEFAQKFADIQRRHVVLVGRDPFEGLNISRDALVRRLQQVLLNLTIRLREMYVERSLREEQCAVTVAEAAAPLRTSAAAILDLEGRGIVAPKEALQAIVQQLGDPRFTDLLPHLSQAREERVLPAGRAAAYLFTTLELASALYRRSLAL
jgi:predicted nucleotidyltransferase